MIWPRLRSIIRLSITLIFGSQLLTLVAWAQKPDTPGNNANDFMLVDTAASVLNGVSATLGAPGPERGPTATAYTTTSAPIERNAQMMASIIDPMQPPQVAPNRVRDLTPVTNGTLGTLKIRRRFTNTTGLPVVALHYRIVDITTLIGGAVPPGEADVRALNSPLQTITLTDATIVTSQALTLQTPPTQASGGGLNSSLSEGVITTAAPLANGASTIVEFNLGVQLGGHFRFFVTIEALTVPPQ